MVDHHPSTCAASWTLSGTGHAATDDTTSCIRRFCCDHSEPWLLAYLGVQDRPPTRLSANSLFLHTVSCKTHIPCNTHHDDKFTSATLQNETRELVQPLQDTQ